MSLYNLRAIGPAYMIAKFDSDFNVESTYTLTASRNGHYTCDCPAGSRSVVTKPCRHRLMLPALLPAVDTDRFYDYDTGKFCEPLGDLADLRAEVDQSPLPILQYNAKTDSVAPISGQQLVGEALRNEQSKSHTIIYGTDEPPIVFDTHRVVEAPPTTSAPAMRRR